MPCIQEELLTGKLIQNRVELVKKFSLDAAYELVAVSGDSNIHHEHTSLLCCWNMGENDLSFPAVVALIHLVGIMS
eukprot:2785868-Amphidinium_carterae.1